MIDTFSWDRMAYAEYRIAIPFLFILIGAVIVVLIDPYIKQRDRKILLLIIISTFILLLQNIADYTFDALIPIPFLRTVVAIIGYSLRPLIILLFCYLVDGKRKYLPLWVLVWTNAAVYLSALFSKISFYITEDNSFFRGPLNYTCLVISLFMLSYLAYISFKRVSKTRKIESTILLFNLLTVAASLFVSFVVDLNNRAVSDLTMAIEICIVFYYIWLHLQFVREHEQALKAEQRIKIMISQIQPHFLYNTLSTIQALCRTDPEKAFVITERFGTYLRQNIDSLSQSNLIPVKKELEHTKIYAEIEMVRFGNITVEYDTPETDFSVPALSIQPLVENAIRHGVRIRDKGMIKVSTAKTANGFEIVIKDNGTGFDVALIEQADETHIGLNNVRERVQSMCGGTLEIESAENAGTKITIMIPKTNQKS